MSKLTLVEQYPKYAIWYEQKRTFSERAKSLKSCPFCGNIPIITEGYWNSGGTWINETVKCSCGVIAHRGSSAGDPDCIDVWNKRI